MRPLIAVCLLGSALVGCSEDGAAPDLDLQRGEVVVFEAGPTIAQCAAPVTSPARSAARLFAAGVSARISSCGTRTGVAFPAVCGGGTGEVILHYIPGSSLPAAQAAGFAPAQSLVNELSGTGWEKRSCQEHIAFFDLARQSAGCAQTRNRLVFLADTVRYQTEFVLLDQAGTCADAAYRQQLYSNTVDQLLCTNAQTIAGPVKNCAVSSHAGLFDTILGNLDKPDLGLGQNYRVWEMPVGP